MRPQEPHACQNKQGGEDQVGDDLVLPERKGERPATDMCATGERGVRQRRRKAQELVLRYAGTLAQTIDPAIAPKH